MRKGFYGLGNLVREHYRREPTDGNVYIFINRRRDKMKLLVWDRTGYVVYYKTLEEGTFELPTQSGNQIKWDELVMILEGVKLDSIKRKKRFSYTHKMT
jgi:transposase